MIEDPTVGDICPGLNELTDSLIAYPHDIISYFTLLKEIDAKCVYTIPHLKAYITRFLQMKKDHPKRPLILLAIRDCLKDLMPCLEEKMHVATIASDNSLKHLRRIEQSFELVVSNEIPEIIRIGPMWEPSMKVSEPKTVQQQRSETRREAIAAKKGRGGGVNAASTANSNQFVYDEYDSNLDDSATPAPQPRKPRGPPKGTTKRKRQPAPVQPAPQQQQVEESQSQPQTQQSDDEFSKPKRSRNKPKREPTGSSTATSTAPTSAPKSTKRQTDDHMEDEPLYCYCQQVSYGEMVGCDGEHCEREWFHLPCIGLKELPRGEWYCDDCKSQR